MAHKPITIYAFRNEATGSAEVLDEASFDGIGLSYDEVNAAMEGKLQRFTLQMQDEFSQARQDVVNNGVLANGQAARPALMLQQYVQSHDVPKEWLREPVVFALISNEIEARVFPSLAGNPAFLAAVRAARERRSNS
jgi:hypothetical protein